MKKYDYTKETDEALRKALVEKREAVRAFRFSTAGSAPRDVKALRIHKKDIARIRTIQTARGRAT